MGHAVKLGGYLSVRAAAGGVRHRGVDPSNCRSVSHEHNFDFVREFKPEKEKISYSFHSVNQELARKVKDYPFFSKLNE